MNATPQLGQIITVEAGAPSVRGFVRSFPSLPARLSPAEFVEGPIAFVAQSPVFIPQFPDFREQFRGDFRAPLTAWLWVGALPPPQATLAVGTAVAMIEGLRGEHCDRARLFFARLQDADPSRHRASWYADAADVVAQVADCLVPDPRIRFAPRDDPRVQAFNDRRTAFYQRWWDLVKRRLAFEAVRSPGIVIKRTARRGVIVRPAILGGQLDGDFALLAGCFGGAS